MAFDFEKIRYNLSIIFVKENTANHETSFFRYYYRYPTIFGSVFG